MSELYKLEFESVSPLGQGGRFYNGDNPNCKPRDVPDEFWRSSKRETDNPWQQYNQLKSWAESGEQLIRNVRLFKMVSTPEWVEVDN